MKIIISFSGLKGGTGKTILSESFNNAASKLGHITYYERLGEGVNGKQGVEEKLATFNALDEGSKLAVFTIDADYIDETISNKSLSEISDMIVVPFDVRRCDMEGALIVLHNYVNAYGLPNRWTNSPNAAVIRSNNALKDIFDGMGHKILNPVSEIKTSFDDKASIEMARQILEKAVKLKLENSSENFVVKFIKSITNLKFKSRAFQNYIRKD